MTIERMKAQAAGGRRRTEAATLRLTAMKRRLREVERGLR